MGRLDKTRYHRAVESGTFDVEDFADELAGSPNHDVGTRLLGEWRPDSAPGVAEIVGCAGERGGRDAGGKRH